MTGSEFKKLRQQLGTLREVADRWGVSHMTIGREERKNEVRRLYAAAIRWELRNSDS